MGSLIGSVQDLFGANQSANSASTTAQSAPLIQPVTNGQIQNAQGATLGGINQQQGLVNALAGQNGIGNQANVFGQEQGLANQYQNIANGAGPNPALAQLENTTGQNIQNQAALAAGQRGSSANVGLLARQIGQQGAATQQQAVGQGAALQAQQQLSALGALQGQQQNLANLSTTQVGQQAGATNNLNNANLANQGQLLGALGGFNQAQVGNIGSQNSANSGIAQTNANIASKNLGGDINGLTGAVATFVAKGGEIQDPKRVLAQALSKKKFPDHMRAMAQIYHPNILKMADGGDIVQPIPNEAEGSGGLDSLMQFAPAIASMAASKGAEVPGKPPYPGKNTTKQDVVPAMLTPEEIVLPLTVTHAKNPGAAAKAFVEDIKGKDKDLDFKEAVKAQIKNRKSKR